MEVVMAITTRDVFTRRLRLVRLERNVYVKRYRQSGLRSDFTCLTLVGDKACPGD